MAHATHVKKSRKTIPEKVCGIKGGIPKGSSYYWWKFAYSGKRFSLTPPKRSQLTQSSFYSTLWDLEDTTIANATADDGLGSTRDDVVSQLEELRDTCQENLDNIPDQLKDGTAGELLQSRIDALEEAIQEYEGLELADDPDDQEFDWPKRNDGETDDAYNARKEAARPDVVKAYWQAKLEEFQGVSINAD